MEDSERWRPDDALALTVRTRVLPIGDLSGPDRAWVIASLTVQGWTVAAIAERLKCSLRLIQQIKAEPMTLVAVYALELQHELVQERSVRRMGSLACGQMVVDLEKSIARLTRQRDALLDRIAQLQREVRRGKIIGD